MIVHTPAALAALSGDNTNEFSGEKSCTRAGHQRSRVHQKEMETLPKPNEKKLEHTHEIINRIFNAVARALPNEFLVSHSLSFVVGDPHTHSLETSAIAEVAL